MKKCCLLSFLLFVIILGFIFFFDKKIIKKMFLPKRVVISSLISKKDQNIVTLLNKALADEWLAYYQYWIGSKIAKGKLQKHVVEELVEHANDEKRHAEIVVKNILELGGVPILEYSNISKLSFCGYIVPPSNGDLKLILEQNIESERCAINVYKQLLKVVGNEYKNLRKDLSMILSEEEEHEQDLLKLVLKIT